MRFAKQSKGKKNIAVLLVVAMLLTIMPVAAFAVDEEDWGVTITPSATEVTTGSTVTFEATATTSSAVVWSSTGGTVTPGETTVDENGVTSSSADVYFDTAGDYTVTAAFTADEDGTVKEAVSNVTVTAPKEPAVVTPEMTQEEIQAAIDENDEIVFEAGTYTDISLTIKGNKTIVPQGTVLFNYTAPKNAISMVEDNSVLTIGDGIGGTLEIADSSNGIYAINTDVTINFADNVTFYVHDSIMNGNDGPLSGNGISLNCNFKGSINAGEGVELKLKNNKAGIYTYGAEPGTQNAPIGFITINFNGCKLIDLSNNNGKGNGSGFHQGDGQYVNAVLNFENCEEIRINDNETDAICFNLGSDVEELNIINCPKVEMNRNGSWGTNGGNINIINSYVDVNSNGPEPWNAVNKTASNLYGFNITIKGSTVNANDCGTYDGIWAAYSANFEDSFIYCNNNGAKDENGNIDVKKESGNGFECYGTTRISNTQLITNGNACKGVSCYPDYNTGETPTQVTNNSILMASGNRGTGIWLNGIEDKAVNQAIITDSTIKTTGNGVGNVDVTTSSNWIAGLATLSSTYIENCVLDLREDGHAYGFVYLEDSNKNTIPDYTTVTGATVAAWKGEKTDSYAASKSHYLYVLSGSLQGEETNMTGTYGDEWNTIKSDDEKYAAPINNEGIKLTRFDLHNEVNKEVGLQSKQAKQIDKSFTYYNPNTNNKNYNYQFRFNNEGEDLIAGESGNAYVWTPASVLHYDATEGTIDKLGTAGEITVGNSVTNQADNNTGLNTRYTQDVTIYGNSLDLAEKTMPTAAREGYVFAGWFVADDEDEAKTYAANGEFENLYKLLNTEFTAASKVATDITDIATAQADKTIYAKWASTLIQGTVFEDETRNNVLDADEYVFEKIPVRLMQDGKVVATTETSVDGKYRFDGVGLGKYTVEIDWPKKDNVAMKNICAVHEAEVGNKFTAGTNNTFATSIEVEISNDVREATLNAGFYNTSSTGPVDPWTPVEPPTKPDPVDPPEEEITDPDVPLVEPEDPTTEIDEPDVPLVEPGTPVEEIDEPEVPLGDAPKTGDAAPIVGLIGLLVVAVAGLVVVRRKFN